MNFPATYRRPSLQQPLYCVLRIPQMSIITLTRETKCLLRRAPPVSGRPTHRVQPTVCRLVHTTKYTPPLSRRRALFYLTPDSVRRQIKPDDHQHHTVLASSRIPFNFGLSDVHSTSEVVIAQKEALEVAQSCEFSVLSCSHTHGVCALCMTLYHSSFNPRNHKRTVCMVDLCGYPSFVFC